ncbi:putative short-chain dehydrogenase/reductase SDR [Conidiobolus coronatus NRRL 28638]|uniref:Putative short-chain dehydrogenase/reductase SDR n=1 Tax=Conidiobolus coronatus (strain ATCC 28846 / CBS 209.66 / NRRL 28638) TaxID=796925 RepID=A0A137P4K9_CONC2|nr:putative short-chain dehydrogenase/reductase SDR [Conidiobolus coronatus NRRL 28638]|eukprot:KXN69871.1 putative short-chain dehydrogenase/reductase SDR [Conidiobolus coronatus NRRL 28638]
MFNKLKLEVKDLSGKHALVTGGNEGIGYFTALHLARMGSRVTIASRSEQKSIQAVESLKKLSKNDQIDYEMLDLGSIKNVREFAEKFSNKYESLDYCVLNAGCTFINYGTTEDGVERTIQINHLGHMQLSLLLLPIIKKAENPRIIFLSSSMHLNTTLTLPKDLESNSKHFGMIQYPKTKLMNVFTVKELARKLKDTNVLVCAVHPGFVSTEGAYKDAKGSFFGYFLRGLMTFLHLIFARNGEQGAITSAFAVTSDKIISGEYYDSCKIAKYNPQANDLKIAKELWEQSLKLVEINESDINYS